MSARKFKFVSPGIFLNEIDNSQIPQEPEAVGPAIVGRTAFGPAMKPVKVASFTDFINLYGNPIPGGGDSGYREGNQSGPTYGPYAAQAYLAAGVSPINYVRLLGISNPNYTSTDGLAGWTTNHYSGDDPTAKDYGTGGGALGLFLWPSGSTATVTGTLGAVFYICTGSVLLSGTLAGPDGTSAGTNALFKFTGATAKSTDIKIQVKAAGDTLVSTLAFNFDRDSQNFIRNVVNTNPILTNAGIVDSDSLNAGENLYWVGETYETAVADLSVSADYYATLIPLQSGSGASYHEMRFDSSFAANTNIVEASTGWFFSQDMNTGPATGSYTYDGMTKLFRFVGLDSGEWPSKNLKISIADIKTSPNIDVQPYGSFSVLVRSIRDADTGPTVLERYDGVNLNPNSPDFIATRIGDRYRKFDYTQRVNKEYGQYDNQSNFIRVEMNSAVEEGLTDARFLPFGVYGPLRPRAVANAATNTTTAVNTYIGNVAAFPGITDATNTMSSSLTWNGRLVFPGTSQRTNASDGGLTEYTNAYFGFRTTQTAASTRYDQSIPGCLRLYGTNTDQKIAIAGLATGAPLEHQWVFSLDDLVLTGSDASYSSGSRAAGTSKTALGSYKDVLNADFNRFTAAFQGGSDGLNIQEAEPFQHNRLGAGTPLTPETSYEINTLEVALDTLADPERVEMNILTVPGVRSTRITDKVLQICENRADALGIIDIPGGFAPRTESTNDFKARVGSVSTTVTNLENRKLNTSYGACYYPWVQIRDSINTSLVWVPPSVVILGTMASSERRSEVWFAPAGFNRGGLSRGAAGLPVVNVTEKLTSKDRDKLYEVNINPIASFPSEGIVVFGQKTLQVTQSALDRINVRRLMIYIKKQVSRFATRVLFDQNVQTTWQRFKADVEPFLSGVKSRFGLTEYRLILDETTTTPDLIDRNILYAKIFLKPARAIEFIAVDFVITRSGASFED
jgi:hypothetical protein